MASALAGLWTPAAIPFAQDGAVDTARMVAHGKALLAEGATGLVALGTTSEANSLGLAERRRAVEAYLDGGIAADRLIVGAGACAVEDAATLLRLAGTAGAAGVLLLPPFYYKGVSDDGLFAFVARLIEAAGARLPPILLYHIPPVAVVGWPPTLIARLLEAFPGAIVGIKDSSSDPAFTRALLRDFPGLRVFPGSEKTLLADLGAGAAGCITATGNINAQALAAVIAGWREPGAAARLEAANRVRDALRPFDLIAAVKAVIAAGYGDEGWRRVRPPLVPLAAGEQAKLLASPAIVGLLAGRPR
jgi:4-hydroxy-tetrahydrodipicolinate synthase